MKSAQNQPNEKKEEFALSPHKEPCVHMRMQREAAAAATPTTTRAQGKEKEKEKEEETDKACMK